MRQFLVLISVLIFAQTIHAQNISGQITDKKTGEGLPFANVILLQDGKQIHGTTTDLDGNYHFTDIKEGIYDIEAIYVGYPNQKMTGIKIKNVDMDMDIIIEMKDEYPPLCHHPIIYTPAYIIPLIDLQNTSTGQTLHSTDIKRRF